MGPLLAVDTILLTLLCFLVVGLLRGHAELLRRTSPTSSHSSTVASTRPVTGPSGSQGLELLPPPRKKETPAWDISGVTLQGGPVVRSMGVGKSTLLAFLGSGCSSCMPFWEGLGEAETDGLPADVRLLVVPKDPQYESRVRLRELRGQARSEVIMSSQAWTDYGVELSPYFIYVDGQSGQVLSEGAALGWTQVISLLKDAIADAHEASVV